MFKNYQTKIKNDQIVLENNNIIPVYDYFHQTASFFGMVERKLFVDLYVHQKPANELKVFYCAHYQVTARQYNSVKKQLDGRVKAKKELLKLYLEETEEKIKQTEELIEKKEKQKEKDHQALLKMKGNELNFFKKVKSYRNLRNYIHQKKRKLHRLKWKLEKLEKDQENNIIRICFGSKECFHKQFHLEISKQKLEWFKGLVGKTVVPFRGTMDGITNKKTEQFPLSTEVKSIHCSL